MANIMTIFRLPRSRRTVKSSMVIGDRAYRIRQEVNPSASSPVHHNQPPCSDRTRPLARLARTGPQF